MSSRRFNYTGRERILASDAVVSLRCDTEPADFDLKLQLDDYEFPVDARVIVEAYRQTQLKRFRYGTIGNLKPNASTALVGFPDPSAVLFRVKVVDPVQGSGKILGEADRISPSDPDGGHTPSLVDVREADLSGELWRLTFEDNKPLLLIEKRYGSREFVMSSPHFKWLVVPQVFRALLNSARGEVGTDHDFDEETDSWEGQIIAQAIQLTGQAFPTDPDEFAEWVTSAIKAFCRLHRFTEKYGPDLFSASET